MKVAVKRPEKKGARNGARPETMENKVNKNRPYKGETDDPSRREMEW
jgi:hypothetical protein